MTVNSVLSMALLFFFDTDFPSVLLFIFLTNDAMYLTFYLVMKYLTGEKLTWPTLIFLVLSGVFMFPAMVFFKSEVKNTGAGPAVSKEFNKPCFEGLNYFDNHDVWHFLSRWKNWENPNNIKLFFLKASASSFPSPSCSPWTMTLRGTTRRTFKFGDLFGN